MPVLLETAALNASELGEYCRNKGLYAEVAGARRSEACRIVNISIRTLQRWQPGRQGTVCEDRHRGEDVAILAQRTEIYQAAKQAHPERWSKDIRNWTPVGAVTLNPDKKNAENLKQSA